MGALLFSFGCDFSQFERRNERLPGPEQMMLELLDQKKFVSADLLAERLINQDPSVQIIDVRKPAAFEKFTLPGAINIPFEEITSDRNLKKLKCDKQQHIFTSNDDLLAEQAWFIHRLSGCKEASILKGGLNSWIENIFLPTEPKETASQEEFDLYSFRKAARIHFIGESKELAVEEFIKPTPKKKIVLKPKPVDEEEEEEEGC